MLVRSRRGRGGTIGLATGVPVDVDIRRRGPGRVCRPGRLGGPSGVSGPGRVCGPTEVRRAHGAGRPDRVISRADDVGVPTVKLVRSLSRSGGSRRPRVPMGSWPATARSGVARTACMPPRSAALVLVRALAWRALAWRGLVGGVARWHRTPGADRSAGSHGLPRHAFAGKACVAGRGGVARRAGVARPRGLARRHRLARPRRLAGSHVVTGRHGGRRLAAGGIGRAAGTARIHAGLVTRTRRLGSGPAGRRPVLVPPAGLRSRRRRSWGWRSRGWRSRGWRSRGWRSRGWRRSGVPQDFRDDLASWRPGRATIPGHVEQAAW